MTNINCSENCVYKQNGKCTLNFVPILPLSNSIAINNDCGYYMAQEVSKKISVISLK